MTPAPPGSAPGSPTPGSPPGSSPGSSAGSLPAAPLPGAPGDSEASEASGGEAKAFTPPTAEQIREHLDAYPFTPPSPWLVRGPLLAIVIVAIGSALVDSAVALVLPWLGLIALFIYSGNRVRRARRLEQAVSGAQSQAMLRRHRRALAKAWRLLPGVTGQPVLRGRLLSIMGQCLSELACHEAAIVVYDTMLADVPEDHPAGLHLRLQRAVESLGMDQLADADEVLRKARGAVQGRESSPLGALFSFTSLLQEVRTAHVVEATERAPSLVSELRPLGVEAGYGYGLVAWCFRHMVEPDEAAAATWWNRATLLLPAGALAYRFRELAELADHPPQAGASAASSAPGSIPAQGEADHG